MAPVRPEGGTRGRGTPPVKDTVVLTVEIPVDKLRAVRMEVKAFLTSISEHMGSHWQDAPTSAYLVVRPLFTKVNQEIKRRE